MRAMMRSAFEFIPNPRPLPFREGESEFSCVQILALPEHQTSSADPLSYTPSLKGRGWGLGLPTLNFRSAE